MNAQTNRVKKAQEIFCSAVKQKIVNETIDNFPIVMQTCREKRPEKLKDLKKKNLRFLQLLKPS